MARRSRASTPRMPRRTRRWTVRSRRGEDEEDVCRERFVERLRERALASGEGEREEAVSLAEA